jgi:hypothetical protein
LFADEAIEEIVDAPELGNPISKVRAEHRYTVTAFRTRYLLLWQLTGIVVAFNPGLFIHNTFNIVDCL